MQILEYNVWNNINNINNIKKLSIVSLILILLQPFFSVMSIKNNKIRNTLLTSYLIFFVSIILIYYFTNQNMSISVANNGHLKWNWLPNKENTIFIFLLSFYFLFLLYPLYIEKNYILLGFFSATLFISLITYLKYGTYESMWCWLSNFIMFIFLFQILFYLPYKEKVCL